MVRPGSATGRAKKQENHYLLCYRNSGMEGFSQDVDQDVNSVFRILARTPRFIPIIVPGLGNRNPRPAGPSAGA
jgi:hypothetical protein